MVFAWEKSMNEMNPAVNAPVNYNLAAANIEAANSDKNKYIRIVGGQVEVVSDPNQASSIETIDQYVQQTCFTNNESLTEGQFNLIKQVQNLYKSLLINDPSVTNKYIKIFEKAIPNSETAVKKIEYFKIISKTAETLEKKVTFFEEFSKRQQERMTQRVKTLELILDLAQKHSDIENFTWLPPMSVLKQVFNYTLQDADKNPELDELDLKFKGIYTLHCSKRRAESANQLLYKAVMDSGEAVGIHTAADVDGLIRICQNRSNFYNYAIRMEQMRGNKNLLPIITNEIKQNIELLANPLSSQVVTVPNKFTSFVLPGGWSGDKAHYMSYEFRKEGDDYYFILHNRGIHSNEFPQLHGNLEFYDSKTGKTYSKTTVRIKTTKEALQDPALIQKLLSNYTSESPTSNQSYEDIQDYFIKSGKGTVEKSDTEKELEEIQAELVKVAALPDKNSVMGAALEPNKKREALLLKALEILKKDSCFQSQQLYGTCAESNFATAEIDLASPYVHNCVERFSSDWIVNKLGVQILNNSFTENDLNYANALKKHSVQTATIARNLLSQKNRPLIIPNFAKVKSTLLTPAEKATVIELIKSGKCNLGDLPSSMREDKDIVLASVQVDNLTLRYASESLRNDADIISASLKEDFSAIPWIGGEYVLKSPKLKELVIKELNNGNLSLKDLSQVIRDDESIVLAAVHKDGSALKYASERLKGNIDIVLAAKSTNIMNLEYASNTLQASQLVSFKDENALIAKLRSKTENLKLTDLPLILRDYPEIVIAALAKDGMALKYASDKLRSDPKILSAAKEQNIHALEFAPDNLTVDAIYSRTEKNKLINELETGKITFQGKAGDKLLPKILRKDRELVLAAIRYDGSAIKYASDELQKDVEVVKLSISKKISFLDYASDTLTANQVLLPKEKLDYITSLKAGIIGLSSLPKILRNDPEIVSAAIERDGLAVEHASNELQADPKIGLLAVKNNPLALQYLHRSLKNNPEIVIEAIKKDGLAIQHASEELQDDPKIALIAVKNNSLAFNFLYPPITSNYEIVKIALEANPELIGHVAEDLKNEKGEKIYSKIVDEMLTKDINAIRFMKYPGHKWMEVCLKKDISTIKYLSSHLPLNAVTRDLIYNGLAAKKISLKDFSSISVLNYDKEIVMKAVQVDGVALQYVSDKLKKDEEVVLASIGNNIAALQFADKNMDCTKLLKVKQKIIKGLEEGKLKFESIPTQLKSDKDIALAGVKKDGSVLKDLSDLFKEDEDIVLASIKNDITTLKYASKNIPCRKILGEKKLIIKALKDGKLEYPSLPNQLKGFTDEGIEFSKAALNNDKVSKGYIRFFLGNISLDVPGEEFFSLGLCILQDAAANDKTLRATGFEFLKKGAELGNIKAALMMAQLYESGTTPGIDKDIGKAIQMYHKIEDKLDAEQLCKLARYYEQGIGVEKNLNKAFEYYEIAASKFNALEALIKVGEFYEDGKVVSKDNLLAFYYFNRASKLYESGYAHYKLGQCYRLGNGVRINKKKAIESYLKAASIYSNGSKDTPKDLKMPIRAYTAAAHLNDATAKAKLAAV